MASAELIWAKTSGTLYLSGIIDKLNCAVHESGKTCLNSMEAYFSEALQNNEGQIFLHSV